MRDVKHAPGPWCDGNEALRTVAHDTAIWNGTVLSSSGKLVAMSFGHTPEECVEIARLLAAAQDLLNALKVAEGVLSGWRNIEAELATIRAAIAKAEQP